MTVYTIHEDIHGFLGIAATPKAAIAYLIHNEWIHDIYDEEIQRFIPIEQKFGSNWKDILLNMSIDEFNNYFVDTFRIEEEPIIIKEHY